MPLSWINSYRKAIFSCTDGNAYGRPVGGSILAPFADSFAPLYFAPRDIKEVMPTEQPCDLAYEFGDGLFDVKELPQGFPKPGGSILAPFADSFAPLYFALRDVKEVMPTEQPCDLAYEFGDGLFDVKEFPQGSFVIMKKIEDIPEERRHRLLLLLKPRLVSIAWQIAGSRYEDSKLVKKSASQLFANSNKDDVMLEYYNCRTTGGPMPLSWINSYRKAIFSCTDGKAYGRLIGGSILAPFADSFAPLYFALRDIKEVMPTEQPCDLAYEFGDGLFDVKEFPQGFPKPVKHPYPFNDQLVIYIRLIGPGVCIGQAWQEGTKIEQVPRKLCSEILMVKDYRSL
ncbi:hypothetical protein AAHE18_12G232700 [Arachis hypogaea]